ncbi:non-specific ribonucleoside hydrolase RihC [Salmonella enterica subsp. enterica serovar Choleraesuis]|nr:non-specific ribonucleoside hydrolase RihC [Salmonella enterica subsp. enterica serovar Choleraesuis]
MNREAIILDTDPGIDDAMAITAAVLSPEIDLRLVTTVAGNVGVDKTTLNARRLLHFLGAVDVPVAMGAARPLTREPGNAASVHGESGMDGYQFDDSVVPLLDTPAFEAIRQALEASPEPMTIVAIGPLTNLALLLIQYPHITSRIKRLVIMGGSAGRGNYTPYAEFNIAIDPEAAAKVFASGIDIVMCGLDVTNRALLMPEFMQTMKAQSRTGAMLHSLFSHYRSGSLATGLRMHDLSAIACLIHPELFTLTACPVEVETQGEWTSGATVVDIENKRQRPANVRVALDMDVAGFQRWVKDVMDRAD